MELYAQMSGGTPVLVVSGRIAADEAPALKDRLAQDLPTFGHKMIVDLSRVEFMGSAGLGALITAVKDARAHSGDVILAAPSSVAHTLLHVSGLMNFITHTNTVAEAVAHLSR